MTLFNYLPLLFLLLQNVLNQTQNTTCLEGCICNARGTNNRISAECVEAGFQEIPCGLPSELEILNLEGNNISKILPYIFQECRLTKVQILILVNCEIRSLTEDSFRGLTELITLDLSGNYIPMLPGNIFTASIPKLRTLHLNDNPLKKMIFTITDDEDTGPLNNLVRLELRDTHLENLTNVTFIQMPNLEYIDLSHSRLRSLPEDIFKPLERLKDVNLQNNPWDCTCRLKPFLKRLKKKELLKFGTSCYSPETRHDIDWTVLDLVTKCIPKSATIGLVENRASCESKDKFGIVWSAEAGETVFKNCSVKASGLVKWTCLQNGTFQSNFENCSSKWLQGIEAEIGESIELDLEMADTLLARVELKTGHEFNTQNHSYYGKEIKRVLALGTNILRKLPHDTDLEIFENLTTRTVGIIANVIRNDVPWAELNGTQRAEAGSELLFALEDAGQELTSKVPLKNDGYHMRFNQPLEFELIAGVKLISNVSKFPLVFPLNSSEQESHLKIPIEWAEKFDNESRVNYVGIRINSHLANNIFSVNSRYSDSDNSNSTSKFINGDILSFSFGNTKSQIDDSLSFAEEDGVRVTFQHTLKASTPDGRDGIGWSSNYCGKPKAELGSSTCVYWDTKYSNWSQIGCKLIHADKSVSICECNHLTAFALLMDVHKHSNQNTGLEILTWIILPISCISLSISIVVLWNVNHTRSLRNLITINLCGCLLFGKLMLLIFVDRNYLCLNDIICQIAGTITHYVFLCAFSWMSMEGMFLYQRIIVVFDGGRNYTRLRHLGAYIVPAVIVFATWIVAFSTSNSAYGNDEFCWLTEKYMWTFMGPVSVVILVNICLLAMTFRIAYNAVHKSKLRGRRQERQQCLSWMKGSFSLTILLGITWILGYLLLMENPWVGTIAAYSFTLLNASQGIFLFVFNVIMDKGIRSKLVERLPSWFPKSSSESSNRTVNAESRH